MLCKPLRSLVEASAGAGLDGPLSVASGCTGDPATGVNDGCAAHDSMVQVRTRATLARRTTDLIDAGRARFHGQTGNVCMRRLRICSGNFPRPHSHRAASRRLGQRATPGPLGLSAPPASDKVTMNSPTCPKPSNTKDPRMSSSPPTSLQTNGTGTRSGRDPRPPGPGNSFTYLGARGEAGRRGAHLSGLCQPSASLWRPHNRGARTEQPGAPRTRSLQMLMALWLLSPGAEGCRSSHEPEQAHCTQVCGRRAVSAHQRRSPWQGTQAASCTRGARRGARRLTRRLTVPLRPREYNRQGRECAQGSRGRGCSSREPPPRRQGSGRSTGSGGGPKGTSIPRSTCWETRKARQEN